MTRYRGYRASGARFFLPAAAVLASACATSTSLRGSEPIIITKQGSFTVGGQYFRGEKRLDAWARR